MASHLLCLTPVQEALVVESEVLAEVQDNQYYAAFYKL